MTISIEKLTLHINNKELFNGLSFTILPKAILYLRGNNGAGKTSLLNIISGLQLPTSGSVDKTEDFKQAVYIGHNLGLKDELTARQHLAFWAQASNGAELMDAAIFYFQLENILELKIYELSSGNKKKLALSKLIICPYKLWLLDEVENGLDDSNKALMENLIANRANNGGIVIVASHNKSNFSHAQTLNL